MAATIERSAVESRDESVTSTVSADNTRMLCLSSADDDAAMGSTAQEKLPLHEAIANFSMDSFFEPDKTPFIKKIKDLISQDPGACQVWDAKGMNPLHVACRESAPLEIIETLVQAWPESVQTPTQNKQKMLSLHLVSRFYAGSNSKKSAVLLFLLRNNPAAVCTASGNGDLALHHCLENYFCTLHDIKLLIKMHPEALHIRNLKGKLPLHIACEKQYMVRLNQDGKTNMQIFDKDDAQDEQSSSSSQIVRYLVTEYPDATRATNARGELPLHVAIRGHQPTKLVETLRSVYPAATQAVDLQGKTALHMAVSCQVHSAATIQRMLDANPSAVFAVDHRYRTPIDLAPRSLYGVLYSLTRRHAKTAAVSHELKARMAE